MSFYANENVLFTFTRYNFQNMYLNQTFGNNISSRISIIYITHFVFFSIQNTNLFNDDKILNGIKDIGIDETINILV